MKLPMNLHHPAGDKSQPQFSSGHSWYYARSTPRSSSPISRPINQTMPVWPYSCTSLFFNSPAKELSWKIQNSHLALVQRKLPTIPWRPASLWWAS